METGRRVVLARKSRYPEVVIYVHTLAFEGLELHLVHKMPAPLFRAWMRGKSEDGELNGAPDILVFGHTHCDLICNFEGILLINPGSPTFPKYPSALGAVGILNIESGKAEAAIVHLQSKNVSYSQ